jgi:hypothetical protein
MLGLLAPSANGAAPVLMGYELPAPSSSKFTALAMPCCSTVGQDDGEHNDLPFAQLRPAIDGTVCEQRGIELNTDYGQGVSTPRTVTGQLDGGNKGEDGLDDKSAMAPQCATVE